MEREVRYGTTEDGVRIAYCVEGKGPPLIMTPTLTELRQLADDLAALGDSGTALLES